MLLVCQGRRFDVVLRDIRCTFEADDVRHSYLVLPEITPEMLQQDLPTHLEFHLGQEFFCDWRLITDFPVSSPDVLDQGLRQPTEVVATDKRAVEAEWHWLTDWESELLREVGIVAVDM